MQKGNAERQPSRQVFSCLTQLPSNQQWHHLGTPKDECITDIHRLLFPCSPRRLYLPIPASQCIAPAFAKGFKRRVSISPSNRSKWTGDNDLANTVEFIANKKMGEMERSGLVGEANLMLLELDGVSLGIRNSGTQAKTNVSLRVASGKDYSNAMEAMEQIILTLREQLSD